MLSMRIAFSLMVIVKKFHHIISKIKTMLLHTPACVDKQRSLCLQKSPRCVYTSRIGHANRVVRFWLLPSAMTSPPRTSSPVWPKERERESERARERERPNTFSRPQAPGNCFTCNPTPERVVLCGIGCVTLSPDFVSHCPAVVMLTPV